VIGFKGCFDFKQYMAGKPTKWGIRACRIVESIDGCLIKCKIYLWM
jgi:hypothetical protein